VAAPLTNAEKRALKARAQRLEPAVKLGHAGASAAFLRSMDEALTAHGLVKMKFTDFQEERKTLAPQIAEQTASELIMQVGHVAVFFRARPEESGRPRPEDATRARASPR
jgi:RNA-binding protein